MHGTTASVAAAAVAAAAAAAAAAAGATATRVGAAGRPLPVPQVLEDVVRLATGGRQSLAALGLVATAPAEEVAPTCAPHLNVPAVAAYPVKAIAATSQTCPQVKNVYCCGDPVDAEPQVVPTAPVSPLWACTAGAWGWSCRQMPPSVMPASKMWNASLRPCMTLNVLPQTPTDVVEGCMSPPFEEAQTWSLGPVSNEAVQSIELNGFCRSTFNTTFFRCDEVPCNGQPTFWEAQREIFMYWQLRMCCWALTFRMSAAGNDLLHQVQHGENKGWAWRKRLGEWCEIVQGEWEDVIVTEQWTSLRAPCITSTSDADFEGLAGEPVGREEVGGTEGLVEEGAAEAPPVPLAAPPRRSLHPSSGASSRPWGWGRPPGREACGIAWDSRDGAGLDLRSRGLASCSRSRSQSRGQRRPAIGSGPTCALGQRASQPSRGIHSGQRAIAVPSTAPAHLHLTVA